MELTKKLDSTSLETEYLQLKRLLYEKFFTYMMYSMLAAVIIESMRAFFLKKFGILIIIAICVSFGIVFARYIRRLKANQEEIITLFFILFYILCLIGQYYGDGGYFTNPLDSFYFGYTSALVDRLFVNRIPKVSYRTAWSISTTLIRIAIIPFNDKGMIGAQFVISAAGIFLDIDKETHDQKLFKYYFDSKDQLVKFKNLVVDDIPGEIVIISKDLMRCLFVNKPFQRLAECVSSLNIRAQLQKFLVQEIEDQSPSTKRNSLKEPNNLLNFLESYLIQADQGQSASKASCNLTFMKSDKQPFSGESLMFEAKIFDIVWDGEQAVTIVFNNLTQQQIIFSLKAANIHKDAVLATVSHELRTPLNGMLGMIQIMQKHIADSQMIQYLRICKSNGELLLSLVNSILDLNQISANKLKLCNEKVNLYELLHDIISLFEYQCKKKGLYLKLEIALHTPKFLVTDKNRLKQILINLIGNALKFTNQGGITISASPSEEDDDYISFKVKDTGMGIRDKDRHKLFRMFGKIEHDDSQVNSHGVGLGLTISNNLAVLLAGDEEEKGIQVMSEYDKGSVFSFIVRRNIQDAEASQSVSSVPMHYVAEDIENNIMSHLTPALKKPLKTTDPLQKIMVKKSNTDEVTNKNSQRAPPPSRNRSIEDLTVDRPSPSIAFGLDDKNQFNQTVLIVDDSPFNITVAEYLVKCHGYKVKSALHGQSAIDLVLNHNHAREPIRLILMDCQMPIMDGYETTRILIKLMENKKVPKIPIVSLTANDSEMDMKACREAGMCDHLGKPLQEVELMRVLRKYGKGEI